MQSEGRCCDSNTDVPTDQISAPPASHSRPIACHHSPVLQHAVARSDEQRSAREIHRCLLFVLLEHSSGIGITSTYLRSWGLALLPEMSSILPAESSEDPTPSARWGLRSCISRARWLQMELLLLAATHPKSFPHISSVI